MLPLVVALVLICVVGVVFWAAWEPVRDDIRENAALNVPLFVFTVGVVTIPPLAWAIAHAT